MNAPPIDATWDSLIARFSCPDWFRDAKFGVWSHWGPQAVPGQDDWYARYMYQEGTPAYRYHCRTYGHPSQAGYKDIIARFTAEKFDAEALVGLYADNGARYFVGQAAHCDNFDNFDSKHHRWNSVNFGPRRDLLGEFAKAARGRGLKFGFSEHLAWSYSWFNVNKDADTTGPYAGVPYDGVDPANQDLYFEPHDDRSGQYPVNPSPAFVHNWFDRMADAINQHAPDLFYTDGGIPFGQTGLDLMRHFYAQNPDGVYTYKDVNGRRGVDLNIGTWKPGAGVEDLEHGVLGGIEPEPWQTDTSSGPWYWNPQRAYKTPAQIVHMLADIVSKNGNLLLNYTQRPDGGLDDETTWIVKSVGAWLKVNGEAIYGTRPWTCWGEGDAGFRAGEMGLNEAVSFGAGDVRFTTKGDTLYAIALGRPGSGERWTIRSLGGKPVTRVELLGHDGPLEFHAEPDALGVIPPAGMKGDLAWALRITGAV